MKKKSYTVDLKGVRTVQALHRKVAEVLPVPKGYGRNYDALYDYLTEYGPGLEIAFANASASFRTLRRVCADAADDTPGLKVVFA